jgi:hypothetical protein
MNKENYLNQRDILKRNISINKEAIKDLDTEYLKANAEFKVGDKYTHDYTEEMVHTVVSIEVKKKGEICYWDTRRAINAERYMHHLPTKRYTVRDGFSGSLEVVNVKAWDEDDTHDMSDLGIIKYRDDRVDYSISIFVKDEGEKEWNQDGYKHVTFELMPGRIPLPSISEYLKEVN